MLPKSVVSGFITSLKPPMLRTLLFAVSLLPLSLRQADPLPAFVGRASVQAGENWKAEVLKALEIKVGDDPGDGVRRVTVTASRATLLRELPALQEHGALSNGIAGSELERRPATYGNALALLLTSYAVPRLYAGHPDLGATRWKVLLSPAPDGAAQGVREMFSFGFDRPRYEGVAWDRLAFTDFPRAAASFSYNLRFTLEMSRELDGSINDD